MRVNFFVGTKLSWEGRRPKSEISYFLTIVTIPKKKRAKERSSALALMVRTSMLRVHSSTLSKSRLSSHQHPPSRRQQMQRCFALHGPLQQSTAAREAPFLTPELCTCNKAVSAFGPPRMAYLLPFSIADTRLSWRTASRCVLVALPALLDPPEVVQLGNCCAAAWELAGCY